MIKPEKARNTTSATARTAKTSRGSGPRQGAGEPDSGAPSVKRRIDAEKAPEGVMPEKSTAEKSGFKKKYTKARTVCMVTFRLSGPAAGLARKVTVVGDFNNWDGEASPMKKFRNGDFRITVALPPDAEYRFRYLIDGSRWENDWCADRYVPNPFGDDDSVVIT